MKSGTLSVLTSLNTSILSFACATLTASSAIAQTRVDVPSSSGETAVSWRSAVWAGANSRIKENPYAPSAVRTTKKDSIRNEASSIRAALNARANFDTVELNKLLALDIRRRREVLTFLFLPSNLSKIPPAYADQLRSLDRKLSVREISYRSKANTHPPLTSARNRMHLTSVCAVNIGSVICGRDSSYVLEPVAGYWTRNGIWMSVQNQPSISWDVLHSLEMFEDLSEKLGIADVRANTAVICGGAGSFLVHTTGPVLTPSKDANTALDISGIAVTADPSLPSIGEMQGMSSGCRIIEAGSNGGGSTGGLPQTGVGIGQGAIDTAVGSIEEMVGKCQGSLISGGISAGADDVLRILVGFTIKGVLWKFALGPGGLLLGLESDAPKDWKDRMDAAQAQVEAKRAEEIAQSADADATHAAQDADALQHEADMAETYAARAEKASAAAAKAAKENPNDSGLVKEAARLAEVARKTREAADKAKKAADDAKADAEKKAEAAETAKKEAERKKKEADDKKKKLKGSSSTQQGTGGGSSPGSEEFGLTTCDQLKNSWARFKSECARTESWNRPGTDCNDFVRRELGCVDIRLIQPMPDDLTMACNRGNPIHVDACAEKRSVMSIWGSSLEPGDTTCIATDAFSASIPGVPYSPMDMCRNPAARPQEGQCVAGISGNTPGTGPAGPTPKLPVNTHGFQVSIPRSF